MISKNMSTSNFCLSVLLIIVNWHVLFTRLQTLELFASCIIGQFHKSFLYSSISVVSGFASIG